MKRFGNNALGGALLCILLLSGLTEFANVTIGVLLIYLVWIGGFLPSFRHETEKGASFFSAVVTSLAWPVVLGAAIVTAVFKWGGETNPLSEADDDDPGRRLH